MVAYRLETPDGVVVRVLANLGAEPMAVPSGELLLASGELDAGGRVPTDVTVWVREAP